MKTIVVTITQPAEGDLVIVNYEAKGGGKTSIKHAIAAGQTPRDVALALAEQVNKQWMPETAHAKVKDNGTLVINCIGNYLDDANFTVEKAGDGGTVVTKDEF